jgi:4-amino-4-deoxy-L-arabinose transferase-like glycosyltransferase
MLGIILLVGIGLRFFNLGAESYWIDEMSTVIEGQQSVQQLFVSGRLDQPPAYYIPFHLWMQLFGDSEISTRLFSALIGIGSIVLVYVIGKMLFGNEIGLLAAFLMAISEFGIYHSQIARFYSFFEFLTLLSFLFFILMIRNQKLIYIALYTIACILLVYSHTYGIFVLVAQNLFFFLQVGRNRNFITTWLISQILIGLALSPYLFPLLFGEGGVKGAVDLNLGGKPAPTLLDPFHTVYRFIITGRRGRSLASFLATYAAAGVFFVGGTWLHAIRKGKSRFLDETKGWFAGLQESPDIRGKFLLLSFWFLCPILLPFIASLVFAPMYDDHFTISAAPAFYLLLAVGIFSIRKIVPIIISLGALAIIVVPGMFNYYAQDIHEQWREVAAYVEGNAESDDVIIFAPNTGIGIQQKTFDWYYPGTLKSCGLVNSKLIDSKAISDAVMQCVSGRNRFWVVIANYSNVTDDERFKSFFLNSNQAIFHKIMEQQFVGLSVYLFELAQ